MNRYILTISLILTALVILPLSAQNSTRKERQLVSKGNKLYTERKFVEAASIYEEALKENAHSASARYNLGLAQIRQVNNPMDTTPKTVEILGKARKNLQEVANRAKDRPGIASKANYNLGNLEFNIKEYAKAVDYYKQALRIDPDDDNARKNLRIAQKQLDKQNQDKQNNDQNQNKDQQQNQQQDKQNQQQDQNKEKEQPKDNKNINQQTAERILQAMDNKENQTRARVNRATKGDKATGTSRSAKRW